MKTIQKTVKVIVEKTITKTVFEPGDIITVRGKRYRNLGLFDTHNAPRDLWAEIKDVFCVNCSPFENVYSGPHEWDGNPNIRFRSVNPKAVAQFFNKKSCVVI